MDKDACGEEEPAKPLEEPWPEPGSCVHTVLPLLLTIY
jgi:hypothetical protein